MVEGYIPHSKIVAYGVEEFGLDGDGLDFFVNVMRRVDNGYMSNESGFNKSDPNVREEVSINNVAGVKNLLSRLGAAAKNAGKDRFVPSRKAHARKRHRQNNNHPA